MDPLPGGFANFHVGARYLDENNSIVEAALPKFLTLASLTRLVVIDGDVCTEAPK